MPVHSPHVVLAIVLVQFDAGAPTPPPLVAIEAAKAEPSTQTPFPESFTGEDIWRARCGTCHGPTGRGNGKLGRSLGARDVTSPQWQAERTDEQIRLAITDGLAGTKMKAFGALGSDEQFDELVALIRKLRAIEPGR